MQNIMEGIFFILIGIAAGYLWFKTKLALKQQRILSLEETILHQGEAILDLQKELGKQKNTFSQPTANTI